jgi:hypothetical protein
MKFKLFIYLLLLPLFSKTSFAQDIEVSPVFIEFRPITEAIQEKDIMVTNHTDEPMIYTLSSYDLIPSENGQRIPAEYGTTVSSLAGFINISPTTIELQANETGYIKVQLVKSDFSKFRLGKINIAAQRESSLLGEVEKLGTGIKIIPSISVLVYQYTDGSVLSDYALSALTPDQESKHKYNVTLNNTGASLVKGKLMFILTDIYSGEEKEMQNTRVSVVPGASKTFSVIVAEENFGKNYLLSAIMDPGMIGELKGTQIELK